MGEHATGNPPTTVPRPEHAPRSADVPLKTEPPGADAEALQELIERAAAGDSEAAGQYLQERLGFLSAMAMRISGDRDLADDLVAEAVYKLLVRWRSGSGPTSNVDSYLISSMRHKLIDEHRSPRSRVALLEAWLEPQIDDDHAHHLIERQKDFALVRSALSRLPHDQQRVITATVVEGRKPGEIASELGRSANAIYLLHRRAKTGLRRSLLQVMLEDRAGPHCRASAADLPATIPEDLVEEAEGGSLAHVASCARCRSVWARFAAFTAAFSLGGVLIERSLAAGPAALGAAAPVLRRADPSELPRHAGTRPARASAGPRWPLAGAAVAATLSAAAALAGLSSGSSPTPPSAPVASLTTTGIRTADGGLELDVRISGTGSAWQVGRLTIALDHHSGRITPPSGWACDQRGLQAACTTALLGTTGGRFRFEAVSPGELGYQLQVSTRAGETVVASSVAGRLPPVKG